ncbi:hypothetical protein Tco_1052891 [Tanacetum coccineum]
MKVVEDPIIDEKNGDAALISPAMAEEEVKSNNKGRRKKKMWKMRQQLSIILSLANWMSFFLKLKFILIFYSRRWMSFGMAFGKLIDGGAATPTKLISASITHALHQLWLNQLVLTSQDVT